MFNLFVFPRVNRISKHRPYLDEKQSGTIQSKSNVKNHPLLSSLSDNIPKTANLVPAKKVSSMTDPLSQALEGQDPLSQFSSTADDDRDNVKSILPISQLESDDEVSQEWLKHRTAILSKFTTTEKLSITSSFLQGGEKCKQSINKVFLFQWINFTVHFQILKWLSSNRLMTKWNTDCSNWTILKKMWASIKAFQGMIMSLESHKLVTNSITLGH